MATKKVDAVFSLKDAFSPKMIKIIQNMDAGGKEAKKLSREIQQMGKKIQATGDIMSKGLTVPIAAVGAASLAAWQQVDEGSDAIIQATGASGEKLEGFEKIMNSVATKVPAEFLDIGKAVGEVNTRFGFTGKTLEGASEKFMRFAQVTGMDATEAVRLASRAMGDAGVDAKDYAKVLDMVAKAGQVSGVSQDVLFENMTKYGAPMRALGFSMEESMSLFAGWEKAGVTTEIAFSGMKKSISNWAKAGKDPREEFKKTMKEIKEAPDIASATTKAIEIFGNKAGPDLADAIQMGKFEIDDMLTMLDQSGGTVDDSFLAMQDGMDRFKTAMNGAKVAGADLGNAILETVVPWIDKLSSVIAKASEWFGNLSDDQKSFVVKAALIVAAIGPAISIFGRFTIGIGKNIKMVKGFIGLIKGAGSAVASVFANPVGLAILAAAALAFAIYKIYKNWDKIVPFFKKLWKKVTTTFNNAVAKIKEKFPLLGIIIQTQIDKIKTIFDGVKTILGGIVSFIKGVFTGNWKLAWEGVKKIFSGVFKTFAGIAKAPINAVISLVNGAIKNLNKIKVSIPKWVPIWGGKEYKIDIPTIPKLYKGTDYWQGGAAMVHDRGGEIIDLPKGSRVYPHDESLAMARAQGGTVVNINIGSLAESLTVREEADISKIMQALTNELLKIKINQGGAANANMAFVR